MNRLVAILVIFSMLLCTAAAAEEYDDRNCVTVFASILNGRAAPRKTAAIEARFDFGDILIPTGEWSKDHKWIEVNGGETGSVWVSVRYISESKSYMAKNENYKKIKVRKWPVNGRVTHYISKGKTVQIEQSILGWGKTKWGWVDLYFLEEVKDE